MTCHNGPLLTDQHFHNTGVPQRDPKRPDRGRAAAMAKVQQDEFTPRAVRRCEIARDVPGAGVHGHRPPDLEAAFNTPSLCNVAMRPPYMYAGQFASLEDVVSHYARSPAATVGHSELAHGEGAHKERKPIKLSEKEIRDVAAFLGTLSGGIVERVPNNPNVR